MIDYNKCLNKQQVAAVTSKARHLRIIAGAGTGKTRALTYRIAFLLSEKIAAPYQLVAITFTNKVANEMKERVSNLIKEYNLPVDRLPFIATYHSFCLRFLRQEISCLQSFTKNFTIADDDDQKKYLKRAADTLNIDQKSDLYKALVSSLSAVKCQGILVDEVCETDVESAVLKFQTFIDFYATYQNILKKNNTMDFDDILIYAFYIIKKYRDVKIKYQNRYKAFLVDEYQDTNNLQYKLLREFLSPDASLTVVGDPDQTIYTWRGADANLIRSTLIRDFSDLTTIVLSENYRSTQTILDTANKLINHNANRDKKNLIAASGVTGEDIDYRILPSQELEAKYIANQIKEEFIRGKRSYSEIAIIYRSNYLSRSLENALAQKRIPYRIYGGFRFYERASVKDALAYLRILINPEDNASTLRLLSAPTRKMGNIALASLASFADSHDLSYLETIVSYSDDLNISAISKTQLNSFKAALGNVLAILNDADYSPALIGDTIKNYFLEAGFFSYIQDIDRKTVEKEGQGSDKEVDNVNELIGNLSAFMAEPPEDVLQDDEGNDLNPDVPALLSAFLANVVLMSQQDEVDGLQHVSLMTVHISKGLEFPEVFVTGLVNGAFPNNHALYDVSDEPLEEERRMFYVAMTRAKQKLHITSYRGYNFISRGENIPSMFLTETGLIDNYREEQFSFVGQKDSQSFYRKPPANSYNNVASIQNKLNSLPKKGSESLHVGHQVDSAKLLTRGLESQTMVANNYTVDMKVISTSYGIGTVIAVQGTKISALFPNKEGDNKKVMFISGALGFKPYADIRED